MGTLRPWNYVAGDSVRTKTQTPNQSGTALWYSKSYSECGWGALFYNGTGKDIVITKIHCLASANQSAINILFKCADVGTSIPGSYHKDWLYENGLTYLGCYGNSITGWTSSNDFSVTISQGHYFIAGFISSGLNNSRYLNLARTNNGDNSNYKANLYYIDNTTGGYFNRDTSTKWRYQTPEIYVDYKDAYVYVPKPTYVDGQRSVSKSIYQGDSTAISLSGASHTYSVSGGISVSESNNTLTVKASSVSNTDGSGTITVTSSETPDEKSYVYVTTVAPKYTGLSVNPNILRPGQTSTITETHSGSGNISYNNFSKSFSYLSISNNTISFNSITNSDESKSFVSYRDETINVQAKYNNSNITSVSKSTELKLYHWDKNDIYVKTNKNRLLAKEGNFITFTNYTSLRNIYDSKFNSVTLSISSEDNEFVGFGESYNKSISLNNSSETKLYFKYEDNKNYQGSRNIIITARLTNDAPIYSTITIRLDQAYEFNYIYPLNTITSVVDNVETTYTTTARLPIYKNLDNTISVFNYPVRVQFPSIDKNDKNESKFYIDINRGIISTLNCKDHSKDISVKIYLSDNDRYASDSEWRTLMVNCPQKISFSSISNLININRTTVPGDLLCDNLVMILPMKLHLINNDGIIDRDNENNDYPAITYKLIFKLNIFNAVDLNDRTDKPIKYIETNEDYSEIQDLTIKRIVCDAQRISYMYGRFKNDDTFTVEQNDTKDNFDAVDTKFYESVFKKGVKPKGKYIYDTQEYLNLLLSGLNSMMSDLIRSEDSKCLSDGKLINKIVNKIPRPQIASGYPIMWNDSDIITPKDDSIEESTEYILNPKYNNNELLKTLFNNHEIYVDSEGKLQGTLSKCTASPLGELLNAVTSFQDSVPLARVVYICKGDCKFNDGTQKEELGKEYTHIIAINVPDEGLVDLGVVDFSD